MITRSARSSAAPALVASLLAASLVLAAPAGRAAEGRGSKGPAGSGPEGEPAPALRPSLEVFAQYALRDTRAQDGTTSWFHQFEVPRVWLGLEGAEGDVKGRVLLEGVRSASEGALVGVGGNSIVARVREAWVGYRFLGAVDVRAGVVPTLVLPTLDAAWGLRALGPAAFEGHGLGAPADLGALVRVELPDGYGALSAAAFNGEGYTNRELNRGKNAAFAATIKPMPRGPLAPLSLFASYERGSAGTGSVAADRVTGAILFGHERAQGLAVATWARGLDGDGARRAWVLEAGVKVIPYGPLLFAARGSVFLRDAAVSGDSVRAVTLAAGARIDRSVEAWLAFDRSAPTGKARDALPGTDNWQLRAVARVAF